MGQVQNKTREHKEPCHENSAHLNHAVGGTEIALQEKLCVKKEYDKNCKDSKDVQAYNTFFGHALNIIFYLTLKYSISGWLMYRPLTDACGYMAPFSVRLMPTLSKSMSFATLKISLMLGSTG